MLTGNIEEEKRIQKCYLKYGQEALISLVCKAPVESQQLTKHLIPPLTVTLLSGPLCAARHFLILEKYLQNVKIPFKTYIHSFKRIVVMQF